MKKHKAKSPQIKTEFVKVSNNDPLVLLVSPLTDFLWEDFIRDSAPRVKYLANHYDISKLSRFGKELFEALYQGEDVTPVISLQDAEDYFRAIQDEEQAAPPKNYKPENAFWIGLMQDVVNSAAWLSVSPVCYGNQWNSGNNSICILNRLSEVLTQQIDQASLDPTALSEAAQELEDLRQRYVQAKKDGDLKKAKEIREMGKQLGSSIEKYQNQMREEMRPEVQEAVNKAMQEAKDINQAMSNLAGASEGKENRRELSEQRALADKLRNNKELLRLANRLGALRRAWTKRKRARMNRSTYSDIVGVKFSDSIHQALPIELALAATEEGRALFALKYSQKNLLSKDYEAPTRSLDRGPILMYVDVSGSMHGESELWSKAMAFVVAEEALKQKREVHICLFDIRVRQRLVLKPDTPHKEELLNFCLSWVCNGGTCFDKVLADAMEHMCFTTRTDILMITDGNDGVDADLLEAFVEGKKDFGVEMNCFCIGDMSNTLRLFADDVREVDIENDADSSELFQNVLL